MTFGSRPSSLIFRSQCSARPASPSRAHASISVLKLSTSASTPNRRISCRHASARSMLPTLAHALMTIFRQTTFGRSGPSAGSFWSHRSTRGRSPALAYACIAAPTQNALGGSPVSRSRCSSASTSPRSPALAARSSLAPRSVRLPGGAGGAASSGLSSASAAVCALDLELFLGFPKILLGAKAIGKRSSMKTTSSKDAGRLKTVSSGVTKATISPARPDQRAVRLWRKSTTCESAILR
mmetsp:Transcript_112866/g.320121  ORF Transcript_112866/g.320121 Transcript_112866/m.320121 type:complete len:239 (+) Transcript_112866:173-889(+)